jgi:uncharacterized membrane protein
MNPAHMRDSLLHRTFRAGITLKGIDGLLEIAAGAALWFVDPAKMNAFVGGVLQHELSRYPHDFIAAHLLHITESATHASPLFASLYLLSHGLVKVILVAALWRDRLWAYPLTIYVFGGFMVYQVYRWTYTHSFALAVLTVFDAFVVWLTWDEYHRQERLRRVIGASRAPGAAQNSQNEELPA